MNEKVIIGTLEINPVFIKPNFLADSSYKEFIEEQIRKKECHAKASKKKFYKKIKIGSWRFYATKNIRLRARCSRDDERRMFKGKNLRKELYERAKGMCECCGQPVSYEDGQMHHILPYESFKELSCDMNNVQFLCRECHKNIHHNPFLDLRQQLDKAKEYGIDLYKHYGNLK